jgi:predicted DNA-binding transcriptional regulator YafY
MAAAREEGVTIEDIKTVFGVSRRSAQRLVRALEDTYPAATCIMDPHTRQRRWSLPRSDPRLRLQHIRADELSALEMGIRRARREGAQTEANALEALRDRLTAHHAEADLRRAETDAEASLEARGHACRPGPRAAYDLKILEVIDAALKAPFQLEIVYEGQRDAAPRKRRVYPFAVLFGARCYLVCRDPESDERLRHFRLDRILEARCLDATFMRDPSFDLERHAARAFGAYHSDTEFGQVIWRFNARAAEEARRYEFHPDQKMLQDQDGCLIVSFEAAGWLEMAWHLYAWGDSVEVIAPAELQKLVAAYRRHDFPSLP